MQINIVFINETETRKTKAFKNIFSMLIDLDFCLITLFMNEIYTVDVKTKCYSTVYIP